MSTDHKRGTKRKADSHDHVCDCPRFCHGEPTRVSKRTAENHQRQRDIDRIQLDLASRPSASTTANAVESDTFGHASSQMPVAQSPVDDRIPTHLYNNDLDGSLYGDWPVEAVDTEPAFPIPCLATTPPAFEPSGSTGTSGASQIDRGAPPNPNHVSPSPPPLLSSPPPLVPPASHADHSVEASTEEHPTAADWEGWGSNEPMTLEQRLSLDAKIEGAVNDEEVDSDVEEPDTADGWIFTLRHGLEDDTGSRVELEVGEEDEEEMEDVLGLDDEDPHEAQVESMPVMRPHPAWSFSPPGEPIRPCLDPNFAVQTVFFRFLMLAALHHSHYHTSVEAISVTLSTLSPVLTLLHSLLSVGIGAYASHIPTLALPGMPPAGTSGPSALPNPSILQSLCSVFKNLVPGLQSMPRFPRSLKTCLKYLGVQPQVHLAVVCKRVKCRHVYYGSYDKIPDKCTQPRCKKTELFWTRTTLLGPKRVPCLVFPYASISEQLARMFRIPGFEDDINGWYERREQRRLRSKPGDMCDLSDGLLWDTLEGPDGKPFMQEKDTIYLIVCGDWFKYQRSLGSATYSSGPIPAFIANLGFAKRYKLAYQLLSAVIGGRFEPDQFQIVQYMEAFTFELKKLGLDGLWVQTEKHPEGHLFKVAMLLVSADFLGAGKFAGFMQHSADEPCHRDKVRSDNWLVRDPPPRTREEHVQAGKDIRAATTKKAKEAITKRTGARDSAYNDLWYWNPIVQVVIDAMHCIFMGLVRNHWFNIWIGGNSKDSEKHVFRNAYELAKFYELRDQVLVPSWVTSLPEYVGQPSGGSLSSDQWRYMACVYGPLILPVVWNTFMPETAKYHNDKLVQEDLENFLRLSSIARTVCRRTINKYDDIPWLREELWNYSVELSKGYGKNALKPNHHSAQHIPDDMENFGPSPGTWTYSGERVNKICKSFEFNNHNGGVIETTMLREFQTTTGLFSLLYSPPAACSDDDKKWCGMMLNRLRTTRGTLGSMLATLIGEEAENESIEIDGLQMEFGKDARKQPALDDDQYGYLWTCLKQEKWIRNLKDPENRPVALIHESDDGSTRNGPCLRLPGQVQWLQSITVNGRRINASSQSNSSVRDSLVEVPYKDNMSKLSPHRSAEVTDLFVHRFRLPNKVVITRPYALVKIYELYRPTSTEIQYPWARWPRLGIQTYKKDAFVRSDARCLVPVDKILCQIARGTVPITHAGRKHVWATCTLER